MGTKLAQTNIHSLEVHNIAEADDFFFFLYDNTKNTLKFPEINLFCINF